ncbi:MAG: pentapeptide repeat-containing protein [Methylobacterium sp.]|nr:pentapeptide repeat-containing protein [Rhodobacter sp.]MCA3655086.1 pentapeptide repeat-containing protein [Methylobacterium sp.]MCA3659267.1 pentapeptide repeat-containing protein [Methylobacterium sp.]MCA3661820.1 pentapeptide repeat-containing protein [Methylobacterium sp.]MCA3664681.1 pentapeptide repeat-containing protein [Methylobacterium sp.]
MPCRPRSLWFRPRRNLRCCSLRRCSLRRCSLRRCSLRRCSLRHSRARKPPVPRLPARNR